VEHDHSDGASERLRAIFEAAIIAIITMRDDGTITDFNPAAERMFGYPAQEIIGRNVSMLMTAEHRSAHDGYIRAYLESGEKRIIGIGREVPARHRDGSTFPIHLTVSEFFIGERRLFTGMIQNISARIAAENQVGQLQNELIHVARLSAMGELASALAHELNQPLTAITAYASAAKRMLTTDQVDGAAELVLKAGEQAQRAGEIIRHLRHFVERGDTERGWHDLKATVVDAAQLGMVGSRRDGIEFHIDAPDGLPPVMMDKVQIQQVVQNFVRNSADALKTVAPPRRIVVRVSDPADGAIEVSVEDTGPGIDETVLRRLFQPFITTKPSGMGIGLSVCRNIIEAHDGRIRGENMDGGGARFAFSIPA